MWLGDIAYATRHGVSGLYLAFWLDRCSRKIGGCDVRNTISEDLLSKALRRALAGRRPPAWLIVHSDQGSQSTATRLKRMLAHNGAMSSMSQRGNRYDKAHAEWFWSRIKAELPDGGSLPGLTEAKLGIRHHLAKYNARCQHSALGHQTFNLFETSLQITPQLCAA